MERFVQFGVDRMRIAIDVDCVERVVAAAAVSALPNAPMIALGVVNVHGDPVAVISMRRRLGLPDRPLVPSDRFLLVRVHRRRLALAVDSVDGLFSAPAQEFRPTADVVPGVTGISAVVTRAADVVYIHDIQAFLKLDEADALARALEAADVR